MSTQPDPEQRLEWSHTRASTIRECARRYFFRYHLARDGWKRQAPAESRHAYLLSQLTTLDMVLGNAVHRCAAELARAVIARQERPSAEALRDEVRQALNTVWRNGRSPDAFFSDPRRHPVLLAVYYDRGVSKTAIERVREKMERCLAGLQDAPVWEDLRQCDPACVHVVDRPAAVEVGGHILWAAPDLVYTRANGQTVLLDWKTGKIDHAEAHAQLALYAVYATTALALDPGSTGFEGQVYDLSSGEPWLLALTDEDVRAARRRLDEETAQLGGRLAALEDGSSKIPATFPATAQRFRCSRCNFWEFCEPEIRHRIFPER